MYDHPLIEQIEALKQTNQKVIREVLDELFKEVNDVADAGGMSWEAWRHATRELTALYAM